MHYLSAAPRILKRFVAQKVYTACARANYKIVPLTNFSKYLHYDASETEVNINVSANNGSKKLADCSEPGKSS